MPVRDRGTTFSFRLRWLIGGRRLPFGEYRTHTHTLHAKPPRVPQSHHQPHLLWQAPGSLQLPKCSMHALTHAFAAMLFFLPNSYKSFKIQLKCHFLRKAFPDYSITIFLPLDHVRSPSHEGKKDILQREEFGCILHRLIVRTKR